jgi:hypothetical protein
MMGWRKSERPQLSPRTETAGHGAVSGGKGVAWSVLVPPLAPAAPPQRPGRHARGWQVPATEVAGPAAVDRTEIVRWLQWQCQRWLIMWSSWRQTYTGFACFTRERTIVDEAEIGRFLDRIERIERARDR